MILSVTLRSLCALFLHLCLTGLPEVAIPYSDVARLPDNMHARQVELSVGRPQTLQGNVHQVDRVPNGLTNSAAITTMFPLRLCGGKLLATSEAELQELMDRLDRVSRKYSLLIDVDNTKVMASDGKACHIQNEQLEQVDTFP